MLYLYFLRKLKSSISNSMDEEFHYYITYLIAVKSGFGIDDSKTIAYASQFVDDNYLKYTIHGTDTKRYRNMQSSVKLPIGVKKLNKILTYFHFLPGDKEVINEKWQNKQITTKNNKIAQKVLDAALISGDMYWLGIATHVFVDTWAHQNFIGKNDKVNGFKGIMEGIMPNIGHLDAFDQPDLV